MEKGIKVEFGSRVVDLDESGPSVTLADGREFHADIVIAADGAQSTIRPTVVGRQEKPGTGPFPLYRCENTLARSIEQCSLKQLVFLYRHHQ